MQEALLNEFAQNVAQGNDRQDNVQGHDDTVNALMQRLQSAIEDENDQKAQEISEMKGMMANSEQTLAQMIKFGMP